MISLMARRILILMALWTLVFVMPLCVGGVVHHSCEYDRAADCSHESACAQDPCALKVVSGDSSLKLTQHHLVSVPLVPVLLAAVPSLLAPGREAATLMAVLPRQRQLYPQGTFPLLI